MYGRHVIFTMIAWSLVRRQEVDSLEFKSTLRSRPNGIIPCFDHWIPTARI